MRVNNELISQSKRNLNEPLVQEDSFKNDLSMLNIFQFFSFFWTFNNDIFFVRKFVFIAKCLTPDHG